MKYTVCVCPADKDDREHLEVVCIVDADVTEIMSAIDILFPNFKVLQLERPDDA